jgi:hypothetical protein
MYTHFRVCCIFTNKEINSGKKQVQNDGASQIVSEKMLRRWSHDQFSKMFFFLKKRKKVAILLENNTKQYDFDIFRKLREGDTILTKRRKVHTT